MAGVQLAAGGDPRRVGVMRLVIGFAQGLAFYGLARAVEHNLWPTTDHVILSAIAAGLFFGPLVWLAGLGGLRRLTLAAWLVAATAIAAGLAAYVVWRATVGGAPVLIGEAPFPTFLAIVASLFIGHHLIAAADEARRPIAPYPLYFDAAWKHAVQLGLSLAFLAAFWAVLELGAALFSLIGIKAFLTTINKPWFFMPVSGLVFAGGVHVADVRAGMTRGLRAIGLTLLSWLMPIMGLLTAAFLLSLPFTGIDALWKVGHATALILFASAVLIVLINAAYQDGSAETRAPKVLQWLGRLTAVVLFPMAALAAWGLWMRVSQHGLTPERITAIGCLAAAACYAVGYLNAAVRPGPCLKGLETVNIVTAFVDLAIILALFTPVADPARIAVADQVARLEKGVVAPDAFDYGFLRFRAGRWGMDALTRLAKSGAGRNAAEVEKRATAALAESAGIPPGLAPPPVPAVDLAKTVDMHPKTAVLPESLRHFASVDTQEGWVVNSCTAEARCDGYVLDLGPRDRADVLIMSSTGSGTVLRQERDGIWRARAPVEVTACPGWAEAFKTGRVRPAAPELQDLDVGGRRVRIITHDCEPDDSAKVSPAKAR